MTRYRLDRTRPTAAVVPALDDFQRRVVDHEGGPLLVLAGPGTGKTTTLVEAIVDLVERRGVDPSAVLALTFSRKAAEQLRDRVTARLGRTVGTSLSATFHSFAYGLLRAYSPEERFPGAVRLLSAAEQDVVLRELLTHAPESVRWPDHLREAVGTRGFASEVQAVLARARGKGLDARALTDLGELAGRGDWLAAGAFMEQYLDVLDSQSAVDYANLVFEAVNIATTAHVQTDLRQRFSHVFVDEYQDTDPGQVALLRALAGDGRNLVVVGDPDQSIYGFRGAEVRGILDFPARFPQSDGAPAPVVALGVTRRFGTTVLAASRAIAATLPRTGSIPAEAWQTFLNPEVVAGADPGNVAVVTYDSARAETEHIADALRRAHLEDGIPWSDMAVLVRSGRTSIPALRRSLVAAGVPVDVASDETPLVREPAVLPLLETLRAVVDLDVTDPADPAYLDVGRAESLLLSPLGGLDATEIRAVARALRRRERAVEGPQRPSAELVRAAVTDPALLEGLTANAARKLRRYAELLQAARAQLDGQATAEEILWTLWVATDWPERLRRTALGGGPGALLAHRDLDALCALFETAARAEEQQGHRSVASFLDTLVAQQIPADTLAERGVRGDAVRLLTAHRSKGLEWRFVVVAHVQEEGWPDLRRRASLLDADRIGVGEEISPVTLRELLSEERRLFYVACTRPRERLLVTAVKSPEDDGEQPSRFVDELGVERDHAQGRPRRPLSLAGVVAELRRTVADESSSPALRRAAAQRLADLARLDDVPVRQADPGSWWGSRARTHADRPIRPLDQPVLVSASMFASILACPMQWFLQREAGGATMTSSAQGFGNLVHAIADRVVKGEVTSPEDITEHVDQVWDRMDFRTPWSSERERGHFDAAVQRFLAWHSRTDARQIVGTEERIEAEVSLDGVAVRLRGYVDRLEIDAEGRAVVVDLKTGKYAPTGPQLAAHPQLRFYQYAVDHGGADEATGAEVVSGGAELVQLRDAPAEAAKVQAQAPLADDAEVVAEVGAQLREVALLVRDEVFPAVSGEHCKNCDFPAICPVKGAGTVLS